MSGIAPVAGIRRTGGELVQCESMRGLAILLVFWFHYLGGLRGYLPNPELPSGLGLFYGGSTGVTLFFVLSGFLLSRPFFQGAPMQVGHFLMRRALRILPMFYVAVLLGGLFSGQWMTVLKSMFFYDIRLGTLFPMGSVWWSLVVELQFYLLLPLVVLLARSRDRRMLLIPALLAGGYAYAQIRGAAPTDTWNDWRDSILGRWPIFMTGAVLAWLQVSVMPRWRSRLPDWTGLPLLLIAMGALVLMCDHRVRTYGFLAHIYWFDHYFIEGLAWALFVLALLNFRFPGYRIFVNPFLHHLGLWSYSLYLLHSAVLYWSRSHPLWSVDSGWQVFGGGVVLLILATALSALTYRFIERPFLDIKSRGRFFPGRGTTGVGAN